jgi:NAD+ synthase (glutamine-hydrolysing)
VRLLTKGTQTGYFLNHMTKQQKEFLDIRNHGFTRVSVVSPLVHLANPEENARETIQWIHKVHDEGAQLAVFPELGLTGYSCQDLFLSQQLQKTTLNALEKILSATRLLPIISVVGLPLVTQNKLFNVAAVLYKGAILALIPKTYLPDYREFRETRWFATSAHVESNEVELLNQKVPFGTDILIKNPNIEHFVLGIDICEDIWMPIPPSTLAALGGATILANLSGSNITLSKDDYRRELTVSSSAKNIAAQMYSSAGFGESTTDVAWDGHSIIADRGVLIAETNRFRLEGDYAVADIDLETLNADRLRMSSWRDNARDNTKSFRIIEIEKIADTRPTTLYTHLKREVDAHPFVPKNKEERDKRSQEVVTIQATSLARRLTLFPTDRRKVIIGVSGGQDSTHALLVAAHTMDILKLPRTNIIAITMPGFGTTDRTYQNAVQLIKSLGATFKEIPVRDLSLNVFSTIDKDPNVHDLTFENTQAWSRKFIELATASSGGGLVLGTGDLSELWLGWCTMFGDHASHYGINAGVPKTLISYLIRWAAESLFSTEPKVQKVLLDILDTPVSPELLPANDKGEIAQKTEEKVGPYELHDFFGYWFVRFGTRPSKIARLAYAVFADTYPIGEIKKWLDIFLRRFFANQYKRSVLPDGPKVGSISTSPRDEWRMPSDVMTPIAWTSDLDSIPEVIL